jgi:hypothetical protein
LSKEEIKELFSQRVRDACVMFFRGYTPKEIRAKHGSVVLEAAIESSARANGYTGTHRALRNEDSRTPIEFPIYRGVLRDSTLDGAIHGFSLSVTRSSHRFVKE